MKILTVPENFLRGKGVKHPKTIVYGAVIILGGVALYIAIRQFKKLTGQLTKKVDKHDVIGSTTITRDDAKSIADRLWNLMNGTFIVSFGSMRQILDAYDLNDADKTMIYNAFGKRNSGFPFYTEGDMYFWFDRKIKFGIDEAKDYWGI